MSMMMVNVYNALEYLFILVHSTQALPLSGSFTLSPSLSLSCSFALSVSFFMNMYIIIILNVWMCVCGARVSVANAGELANERERERIGERTMQKH